MTKPTYEELEAELHLLEEVCSFYANDEDRYLKADGMAEPYGLIPTAVGMKARAARHRFQKREEENTRLVEAAAGSI